jgi:hypothetical protein
MRTEGQSCSGSPSSLHEQNNVSMLHVGMLSPFFRRAAKSRDQERIIREKGGLIRCAHLSTRSFCPKGLRRLQTFIKNGDDADKEQDPSSNVSETDRITIISSQFFYQQQRSISGFFFNTIDQTQKILKNRLRPQCNNTFPLQIVVKALQF